MKKFLLFFSLSLLLLTSCTNKNSVQELSEGTNQLDDICGITNEVYVGIMSHDPWVNTAQKGEDTDAFLWIHNHSIIEDKLISISSDVAQSIEIHQTQKNQGKLQMVPQTFIELPAKFMVELVPGTYHLMLIELTQDINVGEEINITLHFENFTDVSTTIPVKDW